MSGPPTRRALVVDDEPLIRTTLARALAQEGLTVDSAATAAEATARAREAAPDLVILDLRLGADDGLDLLPRLHELAPDAKVIVITAHGSVDAAVAAMKRGAWDFVKKPFDLDELLAGARNALATSTLERRVAYHDDRARRLVEETAVVTRSPAMRALAREVGIVATQPVPVVLVVGETGAGKALVARRLHYASARAKGPFVELNCGAIPESLVESELFGHERGAFSDARERKLGLAEIADGGTLFLDEIGELPLAAQAKLLTFLDSFTVRRVGATSGRAVDVRLVAATNRDLATLAQAGKFRADLFYRLSPVTLRLPALRERDGDVSALADHFLALFAQRYRKRFRKVSVEAAQLLAGWPWPGNVRELKGVVDRAVLMHDDDELRAEHLPAELVARAVDPVAPALAAAAASPAAPIPTLDEIERRYMRAVLALTGGNKLRAAERLGITRQTLAKRLGESE